MRSFLSGMLSVIGPRSSLSDGLTSIDDSLPLCLFRCARLSIVATSSDAHTDMNQRKNVLVEEFRRGQVLHLLPVYQNIARDANERVQPLETVKQTGGERGDERTGQPFVLGCSRVGRGETAPFE